MASDGPTDRPTDTVTPIYPPKTLFFGGIIKNENLNTVMSPCLFLTERLNDCLYVVQSRIIDNYCAK